MNPVAHSTPRAAAKGFSLIELVVVMVVLGVMTAIAVPRLTSVAVRQRADAAARRVAADLDLARRHARATGRPVIVRIDPTAHRITLVGVDPAIGDGAGDYRVTLTDSPYHTRIVDASFNNTDTIAFNGFGVADHGGTITLSAGGEQRTLTLDASSGGVTWE